MIINYNGALTLSAVETSTKLSTKQSSTSSFTSTQEQLTVTGQQNMAATGLIGWRISSFVNHFSMN
jgi:hypothetical protein